jgi:hypothetical protein
MATTVFPPVSTEDKWVQIASTTPTSGATFTFSSIPTFYRKLWVTTRGLRLSLTSGSGLFMQTNGLNGNTDFSTYELRTAGASVIVINNAAQFAETSTVNHSFNVVYTNYNNNNKMTSFTSESSYGAATGSAAAKQTLQGFQPGITSVTSILIGCATSFSASNATPVILYGSY